jgi:hypothetical protein
MPKDTTPRGIRNNNPGNIERNARDKWQGLAPKQTDRRFCQFTDAVYGIRAIARILITYQDKYRVNTLLAAIKKWAPAPENNPVKYAQFIAAQGGLDTGNAIDFHRYEFMKPIVLGIIKYENDGQQPYTPAQIDKGLALAGIEPPAKPIARSATVQAATVGVSTSTVAGGAAVVAAAAPAVGVLGDIANLVRENGAILAVLGCVALIALFGFIVYRRWDDARRLAR